MLEKKSEEEIIEEILKSIGWKNIKPNVIPGFPIEQPQTFCSTERARNQLLTFEDLIISRNSLYSFKLFDNEKYSKTMVVLNTKHKQLH